MSTEHHKAVVRRLVTDVFNGGRLDVLDELLVSEPRWAGTCLDRSVP